MYEEVCASLVRPCSVYRIIRVHPISDGTKKADAGRYCRNRLARPNSQVCTRISCAARDLIARTRVDSIADGTKKLTQDGTAETVMWDQILGRAREDSAETRSVNRIHNSKLRRNEKKRNVSSHTAYSCINSKKKNGQNMKGCTSAETMHSVIACVEA